MGQRGLIGKGKSNQPRGGGNSLRCFPSSQPLPGEEDQREEFSLLAVPDKTPNPAAGFACWEAPETAAAAPFTSFSSTRTASQQCLLAKTHCHSPRLGGSPGMPRTSRLDEASPQQMDREAAAALWPLPHLCHHKDTHRQQRNDFSNQREQLLLNQSCRNCFNGPRNSQQGIPLKKQDSQGPWRRKTTLESRD